MKVIVHFMGIIGEKLAEREVLIRMKDNSSFRSLLDILFEKYSGKIPDIFIDSKRKSFKLIHFMRNYKDIEGLDDKIYDGDEIFFVPPMGGG
ncbi:MAG: MoaD/ThiS family protein [Candidatus Helarchaeota archaeon]